MGENKTVKRKGLKAAAIILGVVAFIIAFLFGFFLRGAIVGKDAAALSEIAAYLKEYGVFDSTTAELREFSPEDAARIMVGSIPDEYAAYYSKEEYEELKNRHNGKYDGIGVSVYGDTLKIAKVTVNSPAFKAGLHPEDVLISGTKGNNTVVFSDVKSVGNFLAEVSDGDFYITVSRDGEEKSFPLKYEKYISSYLLYKDKDSTYAYLGDYDDGTKLVKAGDGMNSLPDNVAYIRFDLFEGDAAKELKGMLSLMKEKGKTKLILDMRGNGGGQMDVLSDFAAGVIKGDSGLAIAYSKDNKGKFTEYSASKNYYYDGIEKIAVIADEDSASATECLIGAMLFYGGAFSENSLIIENENLTDGAAKTFGKGIMQTTFMLSNGGAVKLTTAVIYRPDKTTCIHGKGITVSGDNAVIRSDNKAIDRAIGVLAN